MIFTAAAAGSANGSSIAAIVIALVGALGAAYATWTGYRKNRGDEKSNDRSLGLQELQAALGEGRMMREELLERIEQLEERDRIRERERAEERREVDELRREAAALRREAKELREEGTKKDGRIAALEAEVAHLKGLTP